MQNVFVKENIFSLHQWTSGVAVVVAQNSRAWNVNAAEIAKCICLNFKMYLFKMQNVFVQD